MKGHSINQKDLNNFISQLSGLSQAEVEKSRREFGDNIIPPPRGKSNFRLYLEKFDDPVIRLLLVTFLTAMIVGWYKEEYYEAAGIFITIFLTTAVSFFNEIIVQKAFSVLRENGDEKTVKVFRDGCISLIPRKDIVRNDFILLESGDEVPADGKILRSFALRINNKMRFNTKPELFGGVSVSRDFSDAVDNDAIFRGMNVLEGRAVMTVAAVGVRTTMAADVADSINSSKKESPLANQLKKLGSIIGLVGFGASFAVFSILLGLAFQRGELILTFQQWVLIVIGGISLVLGSVQIWLPFIYDALELAGFEVTYEGLFGDDGLKAWLKGVTIVLLSFLLLSFLAVLAGWISYSPMSWVSPDVGKELLNYFMLALAVIIVAVPDGLGMNVTLSMAFGIRHLARAKIYVRNPDAVETMGAVTTICTRISGVLTNDDYEVEEYHFAGWDEGEKLDNSDVGCENRILEALSVADMGICTKYGDRTSDTGANSIDVAVAKWLNEKKIKLSAYKKSFFPDYEWKFSQETTIGGIQGKSSLDGAKIFYVRGYSKSVLKCCSHILDELGTRPISQSRLEIETNLDESNKKGFTTIAYAYKEIQDGTNENEDLESIARNMVWLGFLCLSDPLRPEVPSAINACRKAGIDVKVITPENAETVIRMTRRAGLIFPGEKDRHLRAAEFRALSTIEAKQKLPSIKAISEADPLDKIYLLNLLKETQRVVAFTGEGREDETLLRKADVGIALGNKRGLSGVEGGDVVFIDNSFFSIAYAVMWGRSLFDNIRRFLVFQLTINVFAVLIELIGPFIGMKMPLTVMQMLWINLIMDAFAAYALATEPPIYSVMTRAPRPKNAYIISPKMLWTISLTALAFLAVSVSLIFNLGADGMLSRHDLTVFFTVFVFFQFWNLFHARAFDTDNGVFFEISRNPAFLFVLGAILIGQILIVELGGNVFRSESLTLGQWLAAFWGTFMLPAFWQLARTWWSSREN